MFWKLNALWLLYPLSQEIQWWVVTGGAVWNPTAPSIMTLQILPEPEEERPLLTQREINLFSYNDNYQLSCFGITPNLLLLLEWELRKINPSTSKNNSSLSSDPPVKLRISSTPNIPLDSGPVALLLTTWILQPRRPTSIPPFLERLPW